MIAQRKVIVDSFCELKEFTTEFEDEQFWDISQHEIIPHAVYVISRQQFRKHCDIILNAMAEKNIVPVLGNPAEGSETMFAQVQGMGLLDLVKNKKILVVSGGHMQNDVPYLFYENFLPKILDFDENVQAIDEYKKNWSDSRPYKFLFLNGRARPHRRALIDSLKPVLDQALWTNLDASHGAKLKFLPKKYEFDFYQNRVDKDYQGFAKYEFFNNDWGEIYLKADAYQDTYFSLVSETVFYYPYSFRTEKIWKPIAIGHPFVVAANAGFYNDLHNLGFKTFNTVIDESFDKIQHNEQRLVRITEVIKQLVQSDLSAFARETREICIYNQQRLQELTGQVRAQFPEKFKNHLYEFINERP
jgi:hypothetical protein